MAYTSILAFSLHPSGFPMAHWGWLGGVGAGVGGAFVNTLNECSNADAIFLMPWDTLVELGFKFCSCALFLRRFSVFSHPATHGSRAELPPCWQTLHPARPAPGMSGVFDGCMLRLACQATVVALLVGSTVAHRPVVSPLGTLHLCLAKKKQPA